MSTPMVQHLLTSSGLRFAGTGTGTGKGTIIGSTVHAMTAHLTTAHHSTAHRHSTEDLTMLLRPWAVTAQWQTMVIKLQCNVYWAGTEDPVVGTRNPRMGSEESGMTMI